MMSQVKKKKILQLTLYDGSQHTNTLKLLYKITFKLYVQAEAT